jgi:hypothetical protein
LGGGLLADVEPFRDFLDPYDVVDGHEAIIPDYMPDC